jgi:hypothetical protein
MLESPSDGCLRSHANYGNQDVPRRNDEHRQLRHHRKENHERTTQRQEGPTLGAPPQQAQQGPQRARLTKLRLGLRPATCRPSLGEVESRSRSSCAVLREPADDEGREEQQPRLDRSLEALRAAEFVASELLHPLLSSRQPSSADARELSPPTSASATRCARYFSASRPGALSSPPSTISSSGSGGSRGGSPTNKRQTRRSKFAGGTAAALLRLSLESTLTPDPAGAGTAGDTLRSAQVRPALEQRKHMTVMR